LDGVECKRVIYTSNDTNLSNYTDWKFESSFIWDDFYYASTTGKIYNERDYIMGKTSVLPTMIDTSLSTKIETDRIVENKVLGVPVAHRNNVTDYMIFKRALQNTN